MAHSLTHLEQLDTLPERSDTSLKLNLLRKQTLPSCNSSNSTRTAETCAKSYNNLMKPLQVSQKRRIVLSLKKASSKAKGLFQNLKYDDFMLRISELKEISKLHEESVFAKDKRKKTEKCEDDDYLKNNLSERAYRYVELARESKKSTGQLSHDNTAVQLPTIDFDSRDNNTERGVKLEDMKEQQVHLSNSKERTIGKQLNNNAHFRHASRKILTPRAQESIANRQEVLTGLLASVDACSLRNASLRSEESPFRTNTSRTYTRHPQLVNENSYYTPLIPSMMVIEDYIDTPSIADSPPKFGAWINLAEAGKNTQNGLSSLRSPILDREPGTVKNGNPKSCNKILEFGATPVKPKLSNVNDFRLTRSTTFDTFSSISKESNSPLKRKITLTSQGLEASSRLDKSLSRSGKLLKKQASSSSSKEQKSNIFQTEIEMILEDDDVKPEPEFSRPVSTVNKIIKSTKSYNTLKHFRASSQTFVSPKSLEPEEEGKSLRKMKIRTPRREFDGEDSPVCKTVQELIEKSYQGDVSEREIGVKNMQELLNSYGFEDTIGDIKTSRPKGRFNSLEGYQGQFNKTIIAKTERFVDKILQRNNKNLYTVK